MCSEHFTKDQFSGESGRKLKNHSYPYLFSHSGLSDEDMQSYIENISRNVRSESRSTLQYTGFGGDEHLTEPVSPKMTHSQTRDLKQSTAPQVINAAHQFCLNLYNLLIFVVLIIYFFSS